MANNKNNKKDISIEKKDISVEKKEVKKNEAEIEECEEVDESVEMDQIYDEDILDELEFDDLKVLEEFEKIEKEKIKHRKALKNLKFERDDLSMNALEVVQIIGMENYRKLVFRYGGTTLYFQQYENLIERKRKDYIYQVYLEHDSNIKLTTTIFGLSESTIRRYVNDVRKYRLNKRIKERKKQN